MKKFVNESIDGFVKPKSEEEIDKEFEKIIDTLIKYLMMYNNDKFVDYQQTYDYIKKQENKIKYYLKNDYYTIENIAHKLYFDDWS